MKRTVIVFGLISGAISSAFMLAVVPFADRIGFDKSMYLGYTSMVLAFLLVFFGIRSYRDNVCDGQISFLRAFGVGILITLISCACYVITWEIVYFNFLPDFSEKYLNHMVETMKASGATQQAIDAKIQEWKNLNYDNPLINSLITFTEPFPVGLIVTLISSLILRRRKSDLRSDRALPVES
jgi:hypothetical protein